jgi:hypothetical protein
LQLAASVREPPDLDRRPTEVLVVGSPVDVGLRIRAVVELDQVGAVRGRAAAAVAPAARRKLLLVERSQIIDGSIEHKGCVARAC